MKGLELCLRSTTEYERERRDRGAHATTTTKFSTQSHINLFKLNLVTGFEPPGRKYEMELGHERDAISFSPCFSLFGNFIGCILDKLHIYTHISECVMKTF